MDEGKKKKLHIPFPTGEFSRKNINFPYCKMIINAHIISNKPKAIVELNALYCFLCLWCVMTYSVFINL